MLVPMSVDLAAGHPDSSAFMAASIVTLFVAVLLILATRQVREPIPLKGAFLLTTLSWCSIALFGSLPMLFGVMELRLVDAVFEAVSGLTTTGSTVVSGLDRAPPGFLLWRSLLQWLGGIGIIVMALVMLPFLRVGGMQLFHTESSDRSEKLLPTVQAIVRQIVTIYMSLSLACALAYMAAGMSAFDAINHAMTTMATGGYSTHDASIGFFEGPAVEWIGIVFMAAAALPFTRYLAAINGRPNLFLNDSQIRLFIVFCTVVAVGLALWLAAKPEWLLGDALRACLFNVVSVVTTTGYASENYGAWGPLAVSLFLAITVVGGCTGSTSGGIKMFRLEILWRWASGYTRGLFLPHAVTRPTYNGRPVDREVMIAVLSFAFIFIGSWGVLTVLLGATGLDLVTAVSGAATALANVGPGLGEIIGPAGNFSPLPDSAKWLLIAGMLLGRLEFFTVLVLLHPAFWRD